MGTTDSTSAVEFIARVVTQKDLLQYGVKGMKWGVHRTPTTKQAIRAHAKANDELNKKHLKHFNNSPRWAGVDLSKNAKLRKEYDDEAKKLFDEVYAKHLDRQEYWRKARKSGMVNLLIDGASIAVRFGYREVIHEAESVEKTITFTLVRNELGHIVSVETPSEMEQSMDLSDFLAHYGIKGMRWGHRRSPAQLAAARSGKSDDTPETSKTPAATAAKPKSVKDMDLKELQDAVARLNLEKQFRQLTEKPKKPTAKDFIKDLLIDIGKTEVTRLAKTGGRIQLEKSLAKKGTVSAKEIAEQLARQRKKAK